MCCELLKGLGNLRRLELPTKDLMVTMSAFGFLMPARKRWRTVRHLCWRLRAHPTLKLSPLIVQSIAIAIHEARVHGEPQRFPQLGLDLHIACEWQPCHAIAAHEDGARRDAIFIGMLHR